MDDVESSWSTDLLSTYQDEERHCVFLEETRRDWLY